LRRRPRAAAHLAALRIQGSARRGCRGKSISSIIGPEALARRTRCGGGNTPEGLVEDRGIRPNTRRQPQRRQGSCKSRILDAAPPSLYGKSIWFFPAPDSRSANRSRVNSSASPSAAGFTAVAVTCHTNRQAMGKNSSGLAAIIRGRLLRETSQCGWLNPPPVPALFP